MKKFERKTVYIYEINGQEKMTVTSAEEAERWDVIFGVAEQVDQVLLDNPPDIKLDEVQRTELSLYLAQNKTALAALLSEGGEVAPPKESSSKASKSEPPKDDKAPVTKQKFVQEFKRPVEPSKDGFSI